MADVPASGVTAAPPGSLGQMNEEPTPTPWPAWVRIVAVVLVVALIGFFVISMF